MKRRFIATFLVIIAIFFVQGCKSVKVEQGTKLNKSRVERLKVGMSKSEVERIMGSSLLLTPFSENRWDYAYTSRINNGPLTKKHVVLYFQNDVLKQIV